MPSSASRSDPDDPNSGPEEVREAPEAPEAPEAVELQPPRSSLAIQSEIDDLDERLQARRSARFRHLFWAAMGISPAAIIPAIGLLADGLVGLVVLLSVLVVVREAWMAARAGEDVRNWEAQLEELRESVEETASGGP